MGRGGTDSNPVARTTTLPGLVWYVAAGAVVAVLASTCGGLALIDGDGASTSGAAGAGGSTATTSTDATASTGGTGFGGSTGWAGAGPGPCAPSCSAWFDQCDDYTLCASPWHTCAGGEQDEALALVQCVCAGCMDLCSGSCVMFITDDEACHGCQTHSLLSGCWYEYLKCIEAWPE